MNVFSFIPYPHIDPVIFHFGIFSPRWYGMMYIFGFILGTALLKRMVKEGIAPFGPDTIDIILLPMMTGIIVGARLGIFVFYYPGRLLSDPLAFFRLNEGGMSFHGGLIGAALAAWYIARKYKRPFYSAAEQAIVGGTFGLAFGRIGNFINCELYGRVTHMPFGVLFPVYKIRDLLKAGYGTVMTESGASLNLAAQGSGVYSGYLYDASHTVIPFPQIARHPSQLYEMLIEGVILGLIVWLNRRQIRHPGRLSAIFLIGYGIGRFIVEFVRVPTPALGLSIHAQKYFTIGQGYCLAMIIAGILIWLHSRKMPDLAPTLPGFGGEYPENLRPPDSSGKKPGDAADVPSKK